MKKQKLWLVSEVFYPDVEIATGNIATEIALKFAEQYDVQVICGPAGYEKKTSTYKDESVEQKITIHRINSFNFNKNRSFIRLLRVAGISLSMFVKGWKIKKTDKAFVISNPAFITPFFGFLKSLKGFDYTMLMHDVFPENLIAAGYVKESNVIYKFLRWFFVKARNKADNMIVLGRDMKDLICQKMPERDWHKVKIIPNWADIENIYPLPFEDNEIIKSHNLQDKIVVSFAGNHGILQNLMAFLKIIEKVKNPGIHFVFAGGGATKDKLVEYVREKKMEHVTFLPSFPRSELNKFQNACTIGLVSLSDNLYGVGVPSKSYNIYAAGKPILFLGNTKTEIAQFVIENNIGWAFNYSDQKTIIDFLNKLNKMDMKKIEKMGAIGRSIIQKEYNKEFVLSRF